MAFSSRVCRYEYRYLYRMTDVELAVEFYLSISFRYRLQKWPHISPTWNDWRRFDSGITWLLYGYIIGCYINPAWEWWYRNDAIETISWWHISSGVEAIFLTSNGRYRVLSAIGSYLYDLESADTSLQNNLAIIETISKWCFSLMSDLRI